MDLSNRKSRFLTRLSCIVHGEATVFLATSWLACLLVFAAKAEGAAKRSEDFGMPSAVAQIAKILNPALVELGFVRNGNRWLRYEEESILVVDVQYARYSPGPHVNLGVYYHKYGSERAPEIVDCHVDTSLISVIPNPRRGIELLNPKNDLPQEVRRDELEVAVRSYGLSWLQSMARQETARAILAQNPAAAHVSRVANDDLRPSLPSRDP